MVTANYTYGESEYSNEASGTASNFPPPKKLRSHSGDRVVLLLWDLPRDTTGLVGYNLYRSDTSEGPYSLIADSLVELYTYDYTVVNGDTFYYVVTALYSSPDGESPFSNEVMGTPEGGLGIEIMDPKANLPGTYSLYQNFPNPFYRETTIRFNLPHSGFVELRVYNLNGRLKQTLVNEERPAGQHSVLWDGKDSEGHFLPSGIYFYRMDTETFTQFRKLILLK